jgi:hypothetical protein
MNIFYNWNQKWQLETAIFTKKCARKRSFLLKTLKQIQYK